MLVQWIVIPPPVCLGCRMLMLLARTIAHLAGVPELFS